MMEGTINCFRSSFAIMQDCVQACRFTPQWKRKHVLIDTTNSPHTAHPSGRIQAQMQVAIADMRYYFAEHEAFMIPCKAFGRTAVLLWDHNHPQVAPKGHSYYYMHVMHS